ncbi:MAG: formylglycine-generating enzyme family protein, partial [Oscillospiraceae bacterium]|nr:formylglycine-generating enzyme family protein [Oscillospiraceae bacterium]
MNSMQTIPGGTFRMGSDSGYPEERPVHTVAVAPFEMDARPVTNGEFRAYCDQTGKTYPPDPHWPSMEGYFLGYPGHPVVMVSWQQAADYAAHYGKRLPTEEEWEYAAAGGLDAPRYPWGDADLDGGRANFSDKCSDYPWKSPADDDGYAFTSPVGSYPPNGYGLFDMAGNVCEWTADWFFAYDDEVRSTASFSDGWGGAKVCRGGCYHSTVTDLRIARRRRVLGGGSNASVGFRCVRSIDPADDPTAGLPQFTRTILKDIARPPAPITLPPSMELCCGPRATDPDTLTLLRETGFTSIEQYVTWETCERAGEGQWDFSHWDAELAKITAAGLKWLPFIIAGPAYSLPRWYRESREHEGLCCLEHNIESKIQTIFDKNFYRYVDRYFAKLAEHFTDHSVFEAVLLGITGDFGEAIMSVWHGNWPTNIPGIYHAHAGYWCNDRFARADFTEKMFNKFHGDLSALNASWGTHFPAFSAVSFPPIESPPDNYRIDEETAAGTFIPSDAAQRRRWI